MESMPTIHTKNTTGSPSAWMKVKIGSNLDPPGEMKSSRNDKGMSQYKRYCMYVFFSPSNFLKNILLFKQQMLDFTHFTTHVDLVYMITA